MRCTLHNQLPFHMMQSSSAVYEMTSLHVDFCIRTRIVCERQRHMPLAIHPRLPPQGPPFCSLSIGKVHVEQYPTDDTQSSNASWINAIPWGDVVKMLLLQASQSFGCIWQKFIPSTAAEHTEFSTLSLVLT
jgi:hypothetical protein